MKSVYEVRRRTSHHTDDSSTVTLFYNGRCLFHMNGEPREFTLTGITCFVGKLHTRGCVCANPHHESGCEVTKILDEIPEANTTSPLLFFAKNNGKQRSSNGQAGDTLSTSYAVSMMNATAFVLIFYLSFFSSSHRRRSVTSFVSYAAARRHAQELTRQTHAFLNLPPLRPPAILFSQS